MHVGRVGRAMLLQFTTQAVQKSLNTLTMLGVTALLRVQLQTM